MLQNPTCWCWMNLPNHLDLESINAPNIAFQKYDGTVLLVTHDHDLIDEFATRIWHFDHGSIEAFEGPTRNTSATPSRRLLNYPSARIGCRVGNRSRQPSSHL